MCPWPASQGPTRAQATQAPGHVCGGNWQRSPALAAEPGLASQRGHSELASWLALVHSCPGAGCPVSYPNSIAGSELPPNSPPDLASPGGHLPLCPSNCPCVTGQMSGQGLVILSQGHPRDRPPTPFGQPCDQEALPSAPPRVNTTSDPAHCTRHRQPSASRPATSSGFPTGQAEPAQQASRPKLPPGPRRLIRGAPPTPHAETFPLCQSFSQKVTWTLPRAGHRPTSQKKD